MNTYIFSGNLTKDAEKRTVGANNTSLLAFTVAVNSGFGDNKHVDFVNCTIWGKRAESKLGEFLVKGKSVSGVGTLIQSEREHDGKTYHNLECNVSGDFELHGGGEDKDGRPPVSEKAKAAVDEPVTEEDIPF